MQLIKDSIFNSRCDVLVNPVNVIGVMGAGLAKQFKEHYPAMYKHYKQCCETNSFNVGDVIRYDDVICFPTKRHWKNPSKIEYIEKGLKALMNLVNSSKGTEHEIKSIAFPLLGCGLGGLNKEDVIPLIENFEKESGIYCELYGV